MKNLEKLIKFTGKSFVVDKALEQADPFNILVSYCFKHPHCKDYRNDAIKLALELDIPIKSEHNTTNRIFQKFFKATCPHCQIEMDYQGGGGSNNIIHIDYKCEKCKKSLTIALPAEGAIYFK